MWGREFERALVDKLLDQARKGQAGILAFEGEAGAGKTELCEYAADAQRLAAQALLDAQGLPGVDLFALAAAALSLLTLEAERRPVLVLVDDCHWLDPLTCQAMAFALRRLDADAVAGLLTPSPRRPDPLPGPWPKKVVGGLNGPAARQLLSDHTGQPVPPQVAQSMVALTGGNPLALIEAARLLNAEELSGAAPLPDPLPMGGRGALSFGSHLSGLPDRTRQALALIALAGAAPTSAITGTLTHVALDPADLVPAEKAGVISMADGRPGFAHPLVRAAAVAAWTSRPPQRPRSRSRSAPEHRR